MKQLSIARTSMLAVAGLLASVAAYAQSPAATASGKINGATLTITY